MPQRWIPALTTIRRALAERILGGPILRQSYEIGLTDPESEVAVHLHVAGTVVDVVGRFSIACAEPFVICVAREGGHMPGPSELTESSLRFSDRDRGENLGEIRLRHFSTIDDPGRQLLLFRVRGVANWCLPPIRLGGHYLIHAYADASTARSEASVSFLHKRAMAVAFIRPHPVVLVSLGGAQGGNIFPMNLMGSLGDERVGLALQVARNPSQLVERARRIAISTVPVTHASTAIGLSSNHRRESIDWTTVPFATSPSRLFGIPVPEFAQRVVEVEIEAVRVLGSHAFVLGSEVSREVHSSGPVLCNIHGFYMGWRQRQAKA